MPASFAGPSCASRAIDLECGTAIVRPQLLACDQPRRSSTAPSSSARDLFDRGHHRPDGRRTSDAAGRGLVADAGAALVGAAAADRGGAAAAAAEWNATAAASRGATSACTSCSASRPRHAGCGGGGRSAAAAELRRAGPAREPAGAPPARLGVGPEVLVGFCLRAVPGHGGGAARGAEGGRRVPAARPELPGRPAGVHGGGCGPAGAAGAAQPLRDSLAPPAVTVLCLDERQLSGIARQTRATPAGRSLPRQPGLRHLHLRLDRAAEGRPGRARGAGQLLRWRSRGVCRLEPRSVLAVHSSLAFDLTSTDLWGCCCRSWRRRIDAGRRREAPRATASAISLATGVPMVERRRRTSSCCRAAGCRVGAAGRLRALASAARRCRREPGSVAPAAAGDRALINGTGRPRPRSAAPHRSRRERRLGAISIGGRSPTPAARARTAAEPSPLGGTGELCIGGAGLARGYLDRPELTAERFVPATPSALAPRRGSTGPAISRAACRTEISSTSDASTTRSRSAGSVSSSGRSSRSLGLHPLVRETIVLAREDSPGDKRLVAYVVAEADRQAIVEELKELPRGQASRLHGARLASSCWARCRSRQRQGRPARAPRARDRPR